MWTPGCSLPKLRISIIVVSLHCSLGRMPFTYQSVQCRSLFNSSSSKRALLKSDFSFSSIVHLLSLTGDSLAETGSGTDFHRLPELFRRLKFKKRKSNFWAPILLSRSSNEAAPSLVHFVCSICHPTGSPHILMLENHFAYLEQGKFRF